MKIWVIDGFWVKMGPWVLRFFNFCFFLILKAVWIHILHTLFCFFLLSEQNWVWIYSVFLHCQRAASASACPFLLKVKHIQISRDWGDSEVQPRQLDWSAGHRCHHHAQRALWQLHHQHCHHPRVWELLPARGEVARDPWPCLRCLSQGKAPLPHWLPFTRTINWILLK